MILSDTQRLRALKGCKKSIHILLRYVLKCSETPFGDSTFLHKDASDTFFEVRIPDYVLNYLIV